MPAGIMGVTLTKARLTTSQLPNQISTAYKVVFKVLGGRDESL
jgi:hypothetical protein